MRRTVVAILCLALMAGHALAQSSKVHTYPGELEWITETDSMKLMTEGKEQLILKVMGFNKAMKSLELPR